MDTQTLDVYNQKAAAIAERHRGNTPNTTHEYVRLFFQAGELTADIGCGSGRDTDWLQQQGFPTIGYDGSEGMLAEAQRVYPTRTFESAYLPDLAAIGDSTYRNVLCNAVLMHLPLEQVSTAIRSLARILQPTGHLVLTYRGSQEEAEREKDGRLFTRIPSDDMARWATEAGLVVHRSETLPDPVRTDGEWSMLVAERPA